MPHGEGQRRDRELALVAGMHYLENLDQKVIATKINASRSTVSRMLKEAVERGIVTFTINHPMTRNTELENQLRSALGYQDAWVLDTENVTSQEQQRALGQLGAQCVAENLPINGSLAICWGRATRLVAENLEEVPEKRIHVIQMIGSMGTSNSKIDGVELTKLAARRLGGTYESLSAPLVVDDAVSAISLMRQSAISKVLLSAEQAECALIGLGSIDKKTSALANAGFISENEILTAIDLGGVGDVSGILIDAEGREVSSSFSSRIIGLGIERLKKIKTTIAVAYGLEKTPVIYAASKAGLVKVLITDSSTASALLKMSIRNHRKQEVKK